MKDNVQVLLSVYRPNLMYLKKQLESLDNQTYENTEVLIFDDCVEEHCNPDIFQQNLKKKRYRMLSYKERNLGYTKAFEYLLQESDADYIAFCDQDDIWDKRKLEKCIMVLKKEHSLLTVTDRKLIDGHGVIYCNSVRHTSHKQHECWKSGDDIGVCNFFTTCAPGMCIVMQGAFARSTVPFSLFTGHDKWVIACANACGKLSYIDEALVYYRRHKKNVTGILNGIYSKKDYEEHRVLPHLQLIREFMERYPLYMGSEEALKFALARKNHDLKKIFKYRYMSPDIAMFEIILAMMPEFLFVIMIRILKKFV